MLVDTDVCWTAYGDNHDINAVELTIKYDYEKTPAAANAVGVWISAFVDGLKLPDIVDINEFFQALESPINNLAPIFTCTCGDFGCGGYYVQTTGDDTNWIWRNHYHPLHQEVILQVEYSFEWANIQKIAQEIASLMEGIVALYPDAELFSGTWGLDISANVPRYLTVSRSAGWLS